RGKEADALTDRAREGMEKAAEEVQGSARSMREGKERDAGDKAAEAAEELERLARQVAGLKAADLATRVGQGESLARLLAKQQQGGGKKLEGKGGKPEEKKAGSGRGARGGERPPAAG